MTITTTRSDCTRDNNFVYLPNASTLGFGLRKAKRGNWVQWESDNGHHVGRVIGRVICEGKVYIEVAKAALDFSSAYVRWVDPAKVRECRKNPPRRVFEFFAATTWDNPEDIHAALAYGVSDLHDQLTRENGT